MTVAASADTDEETVYKLVKALHQNKGDLVASHPSFMAMNPAQLAIQHDGINFHPGAIRFYKEAGIWSGR